MSDTYSNSAFILRHSVYINSVRCFFIFYILVGLPNGFQVRYLPLYFRTHGMSLAEVGLYRLLVLPWLLKGVWTTYIDRNTDVRIWLKTSLFLLVVVCVVGAQFPPTHTIPVVIILLLFNLITSVQDTAVDSLILDAFTPSQLLIGNVAQAVGERIGSIISGGVFSWYIDTISWNGVLYIMAAMYGVGFLTSHFMLPDWTESRPTGNNPPQGRHSGSNIVPSAGRSNTSIQLSLKQSMTKLFRDISWWMVVYVLFYKIGEVGVLNLFPLFLVDKNIDASEIGFWLGIVGQSLSVVGSTATAFYPFGSLLGPLTVLMTIRAVCIVISWMAVNSWHVDPATCYVSGIISLLIVSFTGGAITTCVQTLLMQLSQLAPRHERPKHYALYSFGELIAKLLFAASVGAIAQITSYQFAFSFFSIAAVIMLPYMLLAPTEVRIPMNLS
ncbi:hypothetical protein EGW08_000705 [Elysia chlorotica]|uniref:Major facilitator superfamily (MFS) profile domain-containing protein n=1 Tax=Elysia chlorotica TaxID=188477 RepID=A0A433UCG6_ELYCH|nr:hypothetical protein EGW08_000705 [Elysia chlorotica]